MKKQILLIFNLLCVTAFSQVPCNFTLEPYAQFNNYYISPCNPVVNITASTTTGGYTYFWVANGFPVQTASVASYNQAVGMVTLTITGPGGCGSSTVVNVSSYNYTTTSSVNPSISVVSCGSVQSSVSFTGTGNGHIQQWFSPYQGSPVASSTSSLCLLSGFFAPGVYTFVSTNTISGCTASNTVTITSLSSFPTFSLGSSSNFSVGCSPMNQTTITILNPVSTATPPSPLNYTFFPPGYGGSITPSLITGNYTSTITPIPGTWTVVVKDAVNQCMNVLPVTITQNTQAPGAIATLSTQTLTCANPTIFATGSGYTNSINVSWLVPSTPSVVAGPTLIMGPPNGPPTSTSSLIYANYNLVVTNTVNACKSVSVIIINQNFKPPVSSPSLAAGSPSAVYCNTNNPVVLSIGSSTIYSTGPFAAPYPCWFGPAPQTSVCVTNTYVCNTPGIYTLMITDNQNGCSTSNTISVSGNTVGPLIQSPVTTGSVDCSSPNFCFGFPVNPPGPYRYLITQSPQGAAFQPTNVITYNVNPLLSGTSSQTFCSNMVGNYIYYVSNTVTGCQTAGTLQILPGDPIGAFTVTPSRPSCTACCDGSVSISFPQGFTSYSVTTNSGNLMGNPVHAITNLCFGWVKYCFYNTGNSCYWCDSVNIDYTLGFADLSKEKNNLVLYPNPARTHFYVKNAKHGALQISNAEGKILKEQIVKEDTEIPILDLKPGIYFVEIRNETSVTRSKLIIMDR